MHIAYLINSHVRGGAEGYAIRLIDGVIRRGHRVSLVCGATDPIGREIEGLGQSVYQLDIGPKLSWRRKSLRDIYAVPGQLLTIVGVLRNLKRKGVDLLHVQYKKEQILGSLAAAVAGIPVVWTEHGPLQPQIANNLMLRSIYVGYARKLTQRVMVVSDTTRRSLMSAGIPEGRLVLTRLGIDLGRFDGQRVPVEGAFDLLALPSPRVGLIGSLDFSKGQADFIRAFQLLLERHPMATAILVGDGPEKEHYMKLADELGISARVHFTGYRTDIPDVLAALDISVSASTGTGEGLPTRLLESMAMRVPVVATNVGGTSEIVTDRVTGLLVDPGCPRALWQALDNMLADGSLRRNVIENAYRQVSEAFCVETMIDKTLQVYEAAVKVGKPGLDVGRFQHNR